MEVALQIAFPLKQELVIVVLLPPSPLNALVILGPIAQLPLGSTLPLEMVRPAPFQFLRIEPACLVPLLLAVPPSVTLPLIVSTAIIIATKESAIPMAEKLLPNIADLSTMPPTVTLTPNASKEIVSNLLAASIPPFSSVMITMSVPPILALLPLDVLTSQVLKPTTAKTLTNVMLPIAIHILAVFKSNFNVTILIIALSLLVTPNGTTSPLTKMEKPQVANVPTQLVLATKKQFVPELLPWLLV